MQQAADDSDQTALEAIKADYKELLLRRHQQPAAPKIIHTDPSESGIVRSVDEGSKSIFIVNMEATSFFNGSLGRNRVLMNSLYDSAPIVKDRASGRKVASNYRASALLGIQPLPFFKYLERWGAQAEGNGMLPRLLFTVPEPTLGTRMLDEIPVLGSSAVKDFQQSIKELLAEGDRRRAERRPREVVGFTPAASRLFIEIYNFLQANMGPGRALNGITGQAARGAEHAARLACSFQVNEGRIGPIDVSVLERAWLIVDFHIKHYFYLLASNRPNPQQEADAQAVAHALLTAAGYQLDFVSRKELKSWCPPEMSAVRFERSIQLLIARGQVLPKRDGRGIYLTATPQLTGRPAVLLPQK